MTKSNERSVMTDAQALAVFDSLAGRDPVRGKVIDSARAHLSTRLASTSPAPVSDAMALAWADRHDIADVLRTADECRCAIDDAQTIHAAPQPVVEKDNG